MQMFSLDAYEVLFCINPEQSRQGPYHYMPHPMFIGIAGLLTTSWLLLPTLPSAILLLAILLLLILKVQFEKTAKI